MDRVVVSFDEASHAPAAAELRRDATGSSVERLAPGLGLVRLRGPSDALVARWRVRPPIFVRHVFPVAAEVALHGDERDVEALVAAGRALASLARPGVPFSVQTRVLGEVPYRPRDVNDPVAATSPAPVDVRHPVQVVSIVAAPPRALLGLSDVDDNLSAWAGGERRFAREPGQVSRSELKLLEALEVFGLELPAKGLALDLGAAPGGWTRVLRQRGLRVVAVDPARLHPSVEADSGVRHVPTRAEAYRPEPRAFDVLVNDMRQDARDSARLTASLAPALRTGAVGVVTLKLPSSRPASVVAEALRVLRRRYEVTGVRQLFHNRSEVTAALRASP